MVFLNKISFPVYGIDTQESRFNRVAWMMKTHPMFLSTEPADLTNLDPNSTIIGYDLLDTIKKDDKQDFQAFYETNKGKCTASFDTILYAWLKDVPYLEESIDIISIDIESKYPNVIVKRILDYIGNDQSKTVSSFLKDQTKIENELKNFNTSVIPIEMGEIEIQKITFEVVFKLDVDLVEIFDRLKVSAELPYVNNGGDRHKIFRQFKNIGINWEFGNPDVVQFYVLNTRYPPIRFIEKAYSQGIIVLSETRGEAIMDIETVVGNKNNLEDLIERVFTSLQIEKKSIISKTQHSINSIVSIPQQRLNKYIMADIVSNDALISSLCYIDESAKIGRIRNSISFFYQPTSSEEKVSIALTESPVELKDYRKNPQMYPMDSRYIRVHINRVKDEAMAKEIANFVGRIFQIYLNNKDKVIEIYQTFIPSFNAEGKIKMAGHQHQQRGGRLQDTIPEIFIPGYARACQRPPIVLDDLSKDDVRKKDFVIANPTPEYKQALLFPRTSDEGPQHWYVCKGGYPGLRVNVLKNSGQFPYLPCCYPMDQTGKKSYKRYYLDYDIKDDTSYSHILTTPKFLNKGELGTLPVNLDTLFQNLMVEKTNFYRMGASPTQTSSSSFVNAVSTAMNKKMGVLSDSMFAVCRQNGYSSTIASLRDEFQNGYVNPVIYYRALEEYFKCYIYVFTRTGILHPVHKHTYLRYKREIRPIVLIIEHNGTDSDNSLFPQCEVIIAINKDGEKITNFQDFAIDDVYQSTNKWYSGLNIVTDIDIPPFDIESQGIDSMGKTRTLNIKYKNTNVFVITDPLPPLLIPEKSNYKNNPEELVISFIRHEGMEIVSKTPDRYIAKKKGRIYYFPYKVIRESVLTKFNQNQRIARYLQEYSYYMFSLNERRESDRSERSERTDSERINAFLRENMVVIKDYEYPVISRRFNLNGGYLKDGKLIVQSWEIAQRLGYSIEVLMVRNKSLLKEYSSFELIQEYYLDKNDFTSDDNAVILMTDEALRDWISEKDIEYSLKTMPDSTVATFYLLLGDTICLVQSAESFENAVNIARIWNDQGYNAHSVVEDNDSDYSYYVFESPENIVKHGVSINQVIVWREEDELKYGALLF